MNSSNGQASSELEKSLSKAQEDLRAAQDQIK